VREEKKDIETMLEMTTEHSDIVEEELHDKAEKALRESEQRLRLIVDATPTPVLIFAVGDGRVVFANGMVGPELGLGADEVLGREVVAFFQDSEDPESLPPILAAGQPVDNRELRLRRADGTLRWVELSMRPLELNDQPAQLCAFHDITERKRRFEASSRFVPSEFLTFFQKSSLVELELSDFISEDMTVMFSDVRSFTTISETMTPRENFDFVNAYLGRVSPVVRECG
ncbi:MAG: PAS domain S-box protein, partial [bacterium]|nr:PAS domain S-box protein [bacterium]